MVPDRPVDIAVIGAGNRSSTTYQGLFQSLRPWVNVVAVCDPVKEHADRYADAVDAHAFHDLTRLSQSRPGGSSFGNRAHRRASRNLRDSVPGWHSPSG